MTTVCECFKKAPIRSAHNEFLMPFWTWIGGCKEDSTATEEVKTEAEYKAEAEKEITEENVDKTLDDIEKELEAEMAAE